MYKKIEERKMKKFFRTDKFSRIADVLPALLEVTGVTVELLSSAASRYVERFG